MVGEEPRRRESQRTAQWGDDWQAALVECEQAEKLAAVKAAEMFAELLAARRPVKVPAWQVRGRPTPEMPAWLTTAAIHGGANNVWVYPDDTAEPVDFHSERRANGGPEYVRAPERSAPTPGVNSDIAVR